MQNKSVSVSSLYGLRCNICLYSVLTFEYHVTLNHVSSNSVITPLFEKMLSASDAGRIGRLVLPKKCAEVSLMVPPLSP